MNGVTIYRNREPRTGGELVLYSSSYTNAKKRLVFVNGIANSPHDHAVSCRNLCRLTSCEVLGVYNQTGMHARVVQNCALDKWLDGLFDVEQAIADYVAVGLRGVGLGANCLANGCASSLFDLLLYEGPRWPNSPLCIVAHSQGNLITSNALMLYSKMVTKYKLKHPRIHVFAIASPAVSWPTNKFISVNPYSHGNDIVPALSMWRDLRMGGIITSESFDHPLTTYLADRPIVDAVCREVGTKSPF
jgi:hypothetical protein